MAEYSQHGMFGAGGVRYVRERVDDVRAGASGAAQEWYVGVWRAVMFAASCLIVSGTLFILAVAVVVNTTLTECSASGVVDVAVCLKFSERAQAGFRLAWVSGVVSSVAVVGPLFFGWRGAVRAYDREIGFVTAAAFAAVFMCQCEQAAVLGISLFLAVVREARADDGWSRRVGRWCVLAILVGFVAYTGEWLAYAGFIPGGAVWFVPGLFGDGCLRGVVDQRVSGAAAALAREVAGGGGRTVRDHVCELCSGADLHREAAGVVVGMRFEGVPAALLCAVMCKRRIDDNTAAFRRRAMVGDVVLHMAEVVNGVDHGSTVSEISRKLQTRTTRVALGKMLVGTDWARGHLRETGGTVSDNVCAEVVEALVGLSFEYGYSRGVKVEWLVHVHNFLRTVEQVGRRVVAVDEQFACVSDSESK